VQRESIMGGDEVDARAWLATAVFVEVRASRKPGRDLGMHAHLSSPKLANRISISAVPLRPVHRKSTDLIAAHAEVPGLCNQLHFCQDGVLVDGVEKCPQLIDVEKSPSECR